MPNTHSYIQYISLYNVAPDSHSAYAAPPVLITLTELPTGELYHHKPLRFLGTRALDDPELQISHPIRKEIRRRMEMWLAEIAHHNTIAQAAKTCLVARRTYNRWLLDFPQFKEGVAEAKADYHDNIKYLLFEDAEKGDPIALRTLLRGELPDVFGVQALPPPPARRSDAGPATAAAVPFDAEAYWANFQSLPPEPPRK